MYIYTYIQCCEHALRSASFLLYFNVYSSMADKQLKRRLYFLCYN